jgi:hypothetical protein
MKSSFKKHLRRGSLVLASASWLVTTTAQAHFPWLATDDSGRAVMWFGESTDDRTYPMPAAVQAITLKSDKSDQPIATEPVDRDDLVGILSKLPVNPHGEVSGTVTYGLYHGTKLTYHVEHLPHADATTWPTEPRPDAPVQTVVTKTDEGVSVLVLKENKPLADVEVKLFCEEGHEEASAKTDANGVVEFSGKEVEPGLNAVMVGITDSEATGTHEGKDYTSTSDFLTATFRIERKADGESEVKKSDAPTVDPNSGASFDTTDYPELPEELTSFGATIADGKLYVYGGHTGDAHSYSVQEQSDRLWCLDLSAGKDGKWQSLPGGPKLQGLALVAHGQRLIRIGGFTAVNAAGDDHDLRSQTGVAAFDVTTQTWTDMPALPEPRSSLDAAVIDDTVYVVGGWLLEGESDDSQWHRTAWSLDLSDPAATWQAIATPPFQRRAVSTAAFEGRLYVIGGMQSEGGPTTRVDVYDPKNDSWQSASAIPGSGMSGFGSSAFATGGDLYVSTLDGFVHRLETAGGQWTTIAKTDPARFFHRMLPIDDRQLLMIGGANMRIGKFTAIDAIRLADNH